MATSPSVYVLVIVTIVGDIMGDVRMCSGIGASRSFWFSVCDWVVVSVVVGEAGCSPLSWVGSGVRGRGSSSSASLSAVIGESRSYRWTSGRGSPNPESPLVRG